MNFITLEDVNSCLFSNQGFSWHLIDVSQISDVDFSDVQYDFCKVSKDSQRNGGEFIYVTIEVDSSCWTKGFYAPNTIGANFSDGKLTLAYIPSVTDFKIWLYMGNIEFNNVVTLNHELEDEVLNLNYEELNTPQTITFYRKSDMREFTTIKTLNTGYNLITYGSDNPLTIGYLLVNLVKSDFLFNCTQDLILGKINKVCLGADSKYKPNGSMIGANTPTINVEYNKKVIPVEWDEDLNDYVFDLDLTDKINPTGVMFKVLVEDNSVLNNSETVVVLNMDYDVVSSFNDLVSVCGVGGSEIVQLGEDISFTSNILIEHPVKIVGNNKTFNLNNHSLILKEDNSLNAEKIVFNIGNPAIIQKQNTKLTLTECTFNNNTSTNYNGLGSCVFCDTDYENFNQPEDYTTIINNCNFINNTTTIFHNGELLINNSKFTLTNKDYVNINNVAFIYQTDGATILNGNNFSIDLDTDYYCTNEINLGFAQAIIMCGETAEINGANYTELQNNDSLPLTDNTSNLNVRYYYPQIEDNVYTDKINGKNHNSCCHTVSGVDWVFKNNVEIKRVE